MAAGRSGHSPTSFSRTIEKVFDDAQHTGEIHLSNRKLKEYPKVSTKYDLTDTIVTDLSKNRLHSVPFEVCCYVSTEKFICYHNVIKSLPQALLQLQNLAYIDFSRNQLTLLPPFLAQLQCLEVLLASNNKLVSLPEELGKLARLMELDVSCNEISHLPVQIGDLHSLKTLNVRSNHLVELPDEFSRLRLQRLDVSSNKIQKLPCDFRKIDTLQELILDHNPLQCPPAHICTKGKVHIMKYLQLQAIRDNRKQGYINEEASSQRRANNRKSTSFTPSREEIQYRDALKRHTISHVDSGYNTTEEKSRWSGDSIPDKRWSPSEDKLENQPHVNPPETQRNNSSVSELQSREYSHTRHLDNSNEDGLFDGFPRESQMNLEDEFQRELQKHRADVDSQQTHPSNHSTQSKRPTSLLPSPCMVAHIAEQLPEDSEREERRRMTLKLQEEQKAMMERQREDARRRGEQGHVTSPSGQYRNKDIHTNESLDISSNGPDRPTSASPAYREDKARPTYVNNNYRRTSDSYPESTSSRDSTEDYWGNNGIDMSPNSEFSPGYHPVNNRLQNNKLSPEQELRLRREALLKQSRHEAQMVRRRMEEEKLRMKQIQKEAVYSFVKTRVNSSSSNTRSNDDVDKGFSRDSTPNTSFDEYSNSSYHGASPNNRDGYSKNTNFDPSFTMRRQLEHAREEMMLLENLRKIIESRLKVQLPQDLPAALRDGVVLCHLANHIRPRSVLSIHVPSPAVPKLTLAKCRKNVENFLDACRRIGLVEEKLCAASDILEEKGLVLLACTVNTLVDTQKLSLVRDHVRGPPGLVIPSESTV